MNVPGFEKCSSCKRVFPEYMIDTYPGIYPRNICPVCGKTFNEKIFKEPRLTEDQILVYDEAVEFLLTLKKPIGGYMINPPDDCPNKRISNDGGIWVDLAACQGFCGSTTGCRRYYNFSNMSSMERLIELFENGVIYG